MKITKMTYEGRNGLYRVLKKNVEPYNCERFFQKNDAMKITNVDHPLSGGLAYYQRVQHHPRATIYHVSKEKRG